MARQGVLGQWRDAIRQVGAPRGLDGTGQWDHATLTSIQVSSFMSVFSSLALDPLMATLLLGGARSSAPLMAGLFLSSIFTSVDGRGEAEGVVATGMRRRVREGRQGGEGRDRGERSTSNEG